MSTITINTEELDRNVQHWYFRTKAEFDQHEYSRAGYNRWLNQDWRTRGSTLQFWPQPHSFPCLLIECGERSNPNGPDELCAAIIYSNAFDYEGGE